MLQIEIRPAAIQNCDTIFSINRDAYNDETNRFGPKRNGGPDGYDIQENIANLLIHQECYEIVLNNRIIGWFWLNDIGNATIELEDFCISPAYHNKGYGYQSLQLMLKLDFVKSKKVFALGTPHYSIRNQHLYEKAGFQKVGISDDGFLYLYKMEI